MTKVSPLVFPQELLCGLRVGSQHAVLSGIPEAAAAAAAPTFKDLTLDDRLDDVERIVQYATSPIALQRLVHVRLLADTAGKAG